MIYYTVLDYNDNNKAEHEQREEPAERPSSVARCLQNARRRFESRRFVLVSYFMLV